MTETEKSWLACAIDGEGCIAFYEPGITKNGNPKWARPEMKIMNTDKRFCEYAKQITGVGTVNFAHSFHNPDHFGLKPVYRWEVHGHENVKRILENIRPYFIIKGEKADYVINCINSRVWGRFGRGF